ncbi:MAG: Membrane protein [Frankiales bacterium]|jgi:hypothetical protein|nr:Membrane protein [Frankiales bacterium]
MYTSADEDVDLRPSEVSAWVGWILFAAIALVLAGIFDIIWGIVALARDEVFVAGPRANVINLDYTTWGWINLIFGIVVLIVGMALFTGSIVASIAAIAIAVGQAVLNLLVIGAYPVWSVIVITLDVLVIYAIAVHGHELRDNA